MEVKAVSIDSGDGVTQEAVYAFVRKWEHRGVMATKGASDRGQRKAEIYSLPKKRSEEHTSELQSLMRISYAVFCLKKKNKNKVKKRRIIKYAITEHRS